MSLPIFQTWPLLSESRVALISSFFRCAVFVGVGVDERDFFADVFVEEFCGIEEIVFVILFEDVEFGGVGERAEVDGGGIDGGGDVFEFEAEVAGGESEISNVADEGDVGVVDGDVEVGLVGEGGGGGLFASEESCCGRALRGCVGGNDGGMAIASAAVAMAAVRLRNFLADGMGVSIVVVLDSRVRFAFLG